MAWRTRLSEVAISVRDIVNGTPSITEPILFLWGAAKLGDVEVYRHVHVLLSRFYPDFIQILSRFYPDFILISSKFYPDFIQIF